MFKTWKSNGTAAVYHRTTVLNRVADIAGLAGVKRAAAEIGSAEHVTGTTANRILDMVAA
jgi:hypothetical protein